MSYLSDELKNYYTKVGNKIKFADNHSLNTLALAIWEKLDFSDMDPAALSRIVNGKKLFTLRQLQAFTNILKLNTNQHILLQKALQNDILIKAGFDDINRQSDTKLIDIFFAIPEKLINITRKLRNSGQPQYAIELISLLDNLAQEIQISFPNDLQSKKQIFAKLYNERARCWGETVKPTQVIKHMLPDTSKAIVIGKETNNKEVLNMSYMNIGGAYYVAKQWKNSVDYLEKHIHLVDTNTQIEFLRTLALDYSFLKDSDNFKRVQTLGIKIVSKTNNKDNFLVVSFLEALARSTAIFGNISESKKLIEQAENLYAHESKKLKINKPFFESQILRGKLFILSKSPKIDKNEVNSLLARLHNMQNTNYKRHKIQINKILKEINLSNAI